MSARAWEWNVGLKQGDPDASGAPCENVTRG